MRRTAQRCRYRGSHALDVAVRTCVKLSHSHVSSSRPCSESLQQDDTMTKGVISPCGLCDSDRRSSPVTTQTYSYAQQTPGHRNPATTWCLARMLGEGALVNQLHWVSLTDQTPPIANLMRRAQTNGLQLSRQGSDSITTAKRHRCSHITAPVIRGKSIRNRSAGKPLLGTSSGRTAVETHAARHCASARRRAEELWRRPTSSSAAPPAWRRAPDPHPATHGLVHEVFHLFGGDTI
jgi:hypothetical protein